MSGYLEITDDTTNETTALSLQVSTQPPAATYVATPPVSAGSTVFAGPNPTAAKPPYVP